jgi:hypothetical protein
VTKICPDCNRRRQLGSCRFGGPNVIIKPHCRECCAAPVRDRWRAERPRNPRRRAAAHA